MKNDKTYKKLEENWKKMEEGIMPPTLAFDAGSKLAKANAGANQNDDSLAVTKFIDTFGREPKTNNDDWIEVKKMLPNPYITTSGFDFESNVYRAKQAILNYWKNKRLTGKV